MQCVELACGGGKRYCSIQYGELHYTVPFMLPFYFATHFYCTCPLVWHSSFSTVHQEIDFLKYKWVALTIKSLYYFSTFSQVNYSQRWYFLTYFCCCCCCCCTKYLIMFFYQPNAFIFKRINIKKMIHWLKITSSKLALKCLQNNWQKQCLPWIFLPCPPSARGHSCIPWTVQLKKNKHFKFWIFSKALAYHMFLTSSSS